MQLIAFHRVPFRKVSLKMSDEAGRATPMDALDRRSFLALAGAAAVAVVTRAQSSETIPRVSESACPLEPFAPVAREGFKGLGILRRPPGTERRPAVVLLHPRDHDIPAGHSGSHCPRIGNC
jgi:hypothetical protein